MVHGTKKETSGHGRGIYCQPNQWLKLKVSSSTHWCQLLESLPEVHMRHGDHGLNVQVTKYERTIERERERERERNVLAEEATSLINHALHALYEFWWFLIQALHCRCMPATHCVHVSLVEGVCPKSTFLALQFVASSFASGWGDTSRKWQVFTLRGGTEKV